MPTAFEKPLSRAAQTSAPRIVIVGHANVGKSVLFNHLTGRYATVSNYPGTTVELMKGSANLDGNVFEIIDTPGMQSLFPLQEEERVGRKVLFESNPFLVLHVIDAKNLDRLLPMTFQLLESGLAVVLVLNMMDEAREAGISIDCERLQRELGIPVIPTVCVTGEGLKELKQAILNQYKFPARPAFWKLSYNGIAGYCVEKALNELEPHLDSPSPLSVRMRGLLLLRRDEEIRAQIEPESIALEKADEVLQKLEQNGGAADLDIASIQLREAVRVAGLVVKTRKNSRTGLGWLDQLTLHPLTAFPVLFLVIYFGFYKLVGGLGAGVIVNFLEKEIFEAKLNPFFVSLVSPLPWPAVRELFSGEYGILTLGVRYAFALILPIITLYFFVFAIMEDSGYLPRLAMLLDRSFKKIGLSGRAVIPIALGFGCDTMATMVTRTLSTKRERIITTLLLAVAVPCSAQLGVIFAVMQGHPAAMLIWSGVLLAVFLFVGFLSAQLMPGEKPSFYIELPPLRLPKLENVLLKTGMRVKWYFQEVLPLFLMASVLIWAAKITNVLQIFIRILEWPVRSIGLPDRAASIFLMGFFRRDYGAAGLYDLVREGALNTRQLIVSCVAITLFLPCIAQFLMNAKERGWKTGVAISAFAFVFAFIVSFFLNLILTRSGL